VHNSNGRLFHNGGATCIKLPSKRCFETKETSLILNLETVRILLCGFEDRVFTELTCGLKTWPKYAGDPREIDIYRQELELLNHIDT
jgi:hypothetical protein